LRRLAREGAERLAALDPAVLDTPPWLLARWNENYGEATARAIAGAHGHEPALDLTVKSDPQTWADKLDGRPLPTGSVRTVAHGAVTSLPGFAEGAWWVQDAAAALPARLFGNVGGLHVADLCAAPGGKAAQLAAAGARLTAVDRSPARLERLRGNLSRLSLEAELVCADVEEWTAEPFDAVLIDAPCSSTGTIRRHPDVPWLKQPSDLAALAALQRRLIARAATLTRPGGVLLYCTCSLEPEEGQQAIDEFLAREAGWRRVPITPSELAGRAEFITGGDDLRTLPCHFPIPIALRGSTVSTRRGSKSGDVPPRCPVLAVGGPFRYR
jgi:16S rRNA (cytosine967-C5)-methyltransferase